MIDVPASAANPSVVNTPCATSSQSVANPTQRCHCARPPSPKIWSSQGLRAISTMPTRARYVPSKAVIWPAAVNTLPSDAIWAMPPWMTHIPVMTTALAMTTTHTSSGWIGQTRGRGGAFERTPSPCCISPTLAHRT